VRWWTRGLAGFQFGKKSAATYELGDAVSAVRVDAVQQ
jgi:hypothetical protein